MIKKISLVGAAVAATLAAAPGMASQAALTINEDNADVKLVIAGSSAFQNAFENALKNHVCSSTAEYTKYLGSVTSGTAPNNFAGYTCNTTAITGSSQKLIVFYRSEGGSAFGFGPSVHAGMNVYRLQLKSTSVCGAPADPTKSDYDCSVGSGFDGVQDTFGGAGDPSVNTANAVQGAVDLGFLDEEPVMFVGTNYPLATKLSGIQDADYTAATNAASPLVLQSFGIYLHNKTGEGSAQDQLNSVTGLSREVLADIFRGKYRNWNKVPKRSADGTTNGTVTTSSLPIVVCRRENGSGTQVAAAVFFHHTNCGGSDEFVTGPTTAGTTGTYFVKSNTSTGNERTCIDTYPGAIGFISAEADAGSRRMIQVDGKGSPSSETGNDLGVATSVGDYEYAFEMTAIKRPTLSGDASTLADTVIGYLQNQGTGPTTPNVSFLPSLQTDPDHQAQFPLVTPSGTQPISCYSRSSNSCNELTGQC